MYINSLVLAVVLAVLAKLIVILKLGRSSRPEMFCRPEACNFIKKETLAQVFSCEFFEISKSTFFTEHLWWLLLTRIREHIKKDNKSHILKLLHSITTCFDSCNYISFKIIDKDNSKFYLKIKEALHIN